MSLLLDTHVWVWYVEGNEKRLTKKSVEFLKETEQARELFVSDISFWEVANKTSGRKLLSIDAMLWLERANTAPGIVYIPIDRAALIQSTRLAATPPRDPADRILIATAQLNGAKLVTADREIILYAQESDALSVYDARK